MNEVGCFGKVPAHGDFVWQALPARFVTPWDNWLQSQLLSLREQQPDNWLHNYLRSPIWRFLIQDEELGAATWCGIITPSVDVVGRYFPLTIAASLPRDASVVFSPSALSPWLHHAEETALQALTANLSIEEVLSRVRAMPLPNIREHGEERQNSEEKQWSGLATADESWSEQLLDQIIYKHFEQPCYWSTIDVESGELRYSITDGYAQFNELFLG